MYDIQKNNMKLICLYSVPVHVLCRFCMFFDAEKLYSIIKVYSRQTLQKKNSSVNR